MDRWMNNNNNEIKSPRAAKPPNFQKKKKKGWQVPNFLQDIIIYVSQEDDVMCLL